MAEKVRFIIEVDDNGSAKVVDNTSDSVDNLKKSFDNTSKSAVSLSQQLSTIKGPIGGVIQGFQGLGQAMKIMVANPIGIFLTMIAGLLYTLKRALSDSEEGQEKMNRIMSVFGAIVGNLTDLIASLGEKLISAFENPKKTIEELGNFVKTNIENRITGLVELFPKLGLAIKQALQGNFSEAAKTAIDAAGKVGLGVENVTDKIKKGVEATKEFMAEQQREAKLADQVAKMRNQAVKIERELLVDRSLLEQKIAELKLKSRQEEQFTAEERKKAIVDAQKLEEQLLAKEVKALELKRDAQKLENTFSRTNQENADKEAEAIAAVNQKIADRTNLQRGTQRELNRINKEIVADAKERSKAEEERIKKAQEDEIKLMEDLQKRDEEFANRKFDQDKITALKEIENAEELARALEQIERDRTAELIRIREEYGLQTTDLELKVAEDLAKQRAEVRKKEDEEFEAWQKQQIENYEYEQRLAKQTADTKIALAEATGQALKSLSTAVGEETAAGKALAIASAVIDTYMGANKALAAGAATPPLGYINAAAIIAAGFANVRQIMSTKIPNANDVGGVTSASIPAMPSVGIVSGQMNQTNQLQAQLNSQMSKPTRAYVVGQNVTSQQSLDRHIMENATL